MEAKTAKAPVKAYFFALARWFFQKTIIRIGG
jgi:hypothetical protein